MRFRRSPSGWEFLAAPLAASGWGYIAFAPVGAIVFGLFCIWFGIIGRRLTSHVIEGTTESSKSIGPWERLLWAILGAGMAVDGVGLLLHDLFMKSRWSVTLLGVLLLCVVLVLRFSRQGKSDEEEDLD